MALCSILLSSSYIIIGSAQLAKIGQYVPSPVLAGYQASIGWLLLDSCINMSAGTRRSVWTHLCLQKVWTHRIVS